MLRDFENTSCVTEPQNAIPVERGCGRRVKGGVYLESALCVDGLPIESFLCDPPIPLPPNMKVITRGINAIEAPDPVTGELVTHALDVVGESFYPNAADIVEETRRFGLSRRIQRTFPFQRLGPKSTIILVHKKGYCNDTSAYPNWACPKGLPEHAPAAHPAMCSGIFWEDLETNGTTPAADGTVVRKMPSFSYSGHVRPAGAEPKHQMAVIARFPISRIAVVKGPGDDKALNSAQKANLNIDLVDE